jgi:hypothetical protein
MRCVSNFAAAAVDLAVLQATRPAGKQASGKTQCALQTAVKAQVQPLRENPVECFLFECLGDSCGG